MSGRVGKLFAFFREWPDNKKSLRWVGRQTKPFIKYLSVMLAVEVFLSLLSVFSSVVGKYVVDAATTGGNLTKYALWMAGVTLVNIGIGAFVSLFSTYYGEKFSFGVRLKIFDHVLRSPWRKVSNYHSGDLLTRLTSDVSTVTDGVSSIAPGFLVLMVRLVSAFCVLYYFDNVMALYALALGPLGVACTFIFGDRLMKYQKALQESESAYRSQMQESVANLPVIKAFGREKETVSRAEKLRLARQRIILKRNRMSTLMNVCMRLVFSAGYIGAFCWGAYRLSTGEITYGTMTVFLSLVSQVQAPVINLARTIPQLFTIVTSAKRLREIDEGETETASRTDIPERVGLALTNVSCRYDREIVLNSMNLTVNPGDRVGIVGYSGSGKTTLIRLVLGFLTPEPGGEAVFTHGENEQAGAEPRRFIAYVPQGNTLLSGTVRENLLTGRPDATEEEMWEALRDADAEAFIRETPEGLDLKLTERAGGISEGQAQRVAIARALIRHSPFIILDEATSALDEKTEARVLETITSRRPGVTMLIVTHRRSMLKYCTRALEIEGARVSEKEIER